MHKRRSSFDRNDQRRLRVSKEAAPF